MSKEEMRQLRKQAAHRQRRIIFNNDGYDRTLAKAATPEGLSEVFAAPLLDSHVDSIFYCDSYGFNLLAHNSDVSEVCLVDNLTKELIEQGTDALEIMVDYCRKHDTEIFWSLRVNDEHDSWGADPLPQFKQDHIDCLFGTKEDPPPHGAWSGVDYARPEVREQAFRIIQDVCQRYDIDWLELDFFRQLTCFKSAAWGQPVTQEERDMMTELLRQVRTMTEEVAQERGRPLLIAVRVPDCPEFSRALGLDWQQWLEEDLIDILVVGGYFWLRPWEEAVELGHEYDVPVYPCLSGSRVVTADEQRRRSTVRNLPESYRASAMNVWNSGADGLYVFNFNYRFEPHHPLWRELGNPETLQQLEKVYFGSVMGTGDPSVDYYLKGGYQFLSLPTLCPKHPIALQVAEPQVTTLTVGDNVLWGKAEGIVPELNLRLQVENLIGPQDLSVKLNGQALSNGTLYWVFFLQEGWLEYLVAPELVQQGINNLEITLKQAGPRGDECVLHDLQLQVSYKKTC